MVEYVIKSKEEVEVYLERQGETIVFKVGQWNVFRLEPDGTGLLNGGISKDNVEGLQISTGGGIVVRS